MKSHMVFRLVPTSMAVASWCCGRVSDSRSRGREFESRPARHYGVKTLGKFLTPMCLCHQAITWYWPEGGDARRGRWWQPTMGPWLCMLSPAGWLPRVRDQLRALTLDIYEYGYLYLFLYQHRWPWMTLNGVIGLILLYFTEFDSFAGLLRHRGWRLIYIVCTISSSHKFHFWPQLTHPAARSLCDSWATCLCCNHELQAVNMSKRIFSSFNWLNYWQTKQMRYFIDDLITTAAFFKVSYADLNSVCAQACET